MSVRMRHTRGHSGNRRSHHALEVVKAVKDAESGKLRLPHRLDESTGLYRGKQLFTPKTKVKQPKLPKGKVSEPDAHALHEHVHEAEGTKGVIGKVASAVRPRSRSGFGGGV